MSSDPSTIHQQILAALAADTDFGLVTAGFAQAFCLLIDQDFAWPSRTQVIGARYLGRAKT